MRINPLLLSGALVLAACATTGGEPRSARIVEPTGASRAALQQAVAQALGVEVVLGEEALTGSSTLVLERQARHSQARVQGREMADPERFFLLRHEGDCLLEHERTGRRYPLSDTRCEVE